jgi:ABC-type nitrate/sulfonate/bicarbonate transport system substrate-binding protein
VPNFKKIFQFSALILFCCLSIFSTSSTAENPDNKNLKNITLQLAWLHQFQFAGYYAAVEKGYYKEAGFQVNIIEGRPGLNPVEEVISSRADFGVGRSEILLHRLNGEPLVAIAPILQHSAIVFLAKRESKITSPHDMIGKRVMMLSGDNAAEYLAMFLEEGVPLNQIERIPSSYNINDLIEGKTDVFNAYSTNEPYLLKLKNIPANIIKPINYGIDFYGDTLFTSEKKVKQAASETKKFRAASIRGWKYALENQDEMIEIILSKYKSEKTKIHLQYEANALKKLIMPELIELGHMNPGRWDQMAQTYVKLQMADPGYSLEGFVYDPDPAPDYTMMKWLFWMALFLSLIAFLYIVLLRFHNERMQVEIDQRKKTEESLLESERKSKQILNSLTDMVVEVDSNMKIIWANKSALDINPDAIGQYCFTAFPGNKEMCDGCCCARAFETQRLEQAVMYQPSSKTAGESYWENIGIPLKNSDGEMTVLEVSRNVTNRVQAENQKKELIHDLKSALKEIKKLSGMLPICSHCKKIRDDKGYWNQIENYISEHSEAEFSHGICKECAEKYYPDLGLYED